MMKDERLAIVNCLSNVLAMLRVNDRQGAYVLLRDLRTELIKEFQRPVSESYK